MNAPFSPSTSARMVAPGPNPGIVAIVSAVLFCVSVALFESMHGLHFPYPGDTASTMVTYFAAAAARVQFGALLQCGSAIALGIVTAAATNRMRSLGACGIGIRVAFFGGSVAALLSHRGRRGLDSRPTRRCRRVFTWCAGSTRTLPPRIHVGWPRLRGIPRAAACRTICVRIAHSAFAAMACLGRPRDCGTRGTELPLDACAGFRHAHSVDALPRLPVVDHRRVHACHDDAHTFAKSGVIKMRRASASIAVYRSQFETVTELLLQNLPVHSPQTATLEIEIRKEKAT